MKKFILVLALSLSAMLLAAPALANSSGGLVAVKTDEGVFLSWNMTDFGAEYTLYRNGEEVITTSATCYTDKGADGSDVYNINGGESVPVWEKQYLEIPISAPTLDLGDVESNLWYVDIIPRSGTEMNIGSQWALYPQSEGVYVPLNAEGRVIDVAAQAVEAGGSVGTYSFNNGDNQKFILEESDDGYYIKGKQSDLYLSVDESGAVTIQSIEQATVFDINDADAFSLSASVLEVVKSIAGGITYNANDASVGDLDGDGEYEIVLKWDPSDAKDASVQGNTGKVFIDAYKLDGTRLWRIDLGPNVRAGAHDTQFLVYDLDGDGKAEVAFRTADGTVDGVGNVIGDPDAIWTNNWSGKNLEGPLWVTVFEGTTGRAAASVPFDPQSNEPSISIFGDNYGNRSERYNACIAYLDGEKPYMVFQRGYYGGRAGEGPGRTVIAAYSYSDGKIDKYWRFDTMDEGNDKYIGHGNHNISVGDADGDGKDEIFTGSLTIDDDGSVLWCAYFGHGDAMHLGDFDPYHEGLEFFTVHENGPYGFTIFDAATGEILYKREAGKDTGRGVIANIGPFGGSYVAWAGSGAGKINSLGENLDLPFNTMNFRIFWDGDLYEELLDGTNIYKIDGTGQQIPILQAGTDGSASNNGSKSTPCLQADILGDWREEVIWRSADNTSLRVYTTTIPTEFSLMPLMTDHVYSMGVVWQNSSYNQPPHLGYYPAGIVELTLGESLAKENGLLAELDAAPYTENGRTLVPLRFIGEALGAKVDYSEGMITVAAGDRTVIMNIGSADYTVNGEKRTMETAPVISENRTMVPVRAVAEAFGMDVIWNGELQKVIIKRGGMVQITVTD